MYNQDIYLSIYLSPLFSRFFSHRGHYRVLSRVPYAIYILYIDKYSMCVHVQLLHSCLTLCDPVDHSPSGSSIHGILQARILEWVAMSFSRESSQFRD